MGGDIAAVFVDEFDVVIVERDGGDGEESEGGKLITEVYPERAGGPTGKNKKDAGLRGGCARLCLCG